MINWGMSLQRPSPMPSKLCFVSYKINLHGASTFTKVANHLQSNEDAWFAAHHQPQFVYHSLIYIYVQFLLTLSLYALSSLCLKLFLLVLPVTSNQRRMQAMLPHFAYYSLIYTYVQFLLTLSLYAWSFHCQLLFKQDFPRGLKLYAVFSKIIRGPLDT